MALVPQDQWDRVYRELTQRLPSRSPLRHLDEGLVDTVAGFVLNIDSSQHVEIVRLLAGYGHEPTLALLREIATADPTRYPDRQKDAEMAQAILAEATSTAPAQPGAAPTVVYVDRPAPAPEPMALQPFVPEPSPPESTGQVIGRAYDALQELRRADALPIEDRAPLAALISVLQTKNGANL